MAVQLGSGPTAVGALGRVYAESGDKVSARKLLDQLVESSKQVYIPATAIAEVCAGLGEKDRAFKSLDEGYAERAAWMYTLMLKPELDSLRSQICRSAATNESDDVDVRSKLRVGSQFEGHKRFPADDDFLYELCYCSARWQLFSFLARLKLSPGPSIFSTFAVAGFLLIAVCFKASSKSVRAIGTRFLSILLR